MRDHQLSVRRPMCSSVSQVGDAQKTAQARGIRLAAVATTATIAAVRVYSQHHGVAVRVWITARPQERELDGVRLDGFLPGTVQQVSTSIGSWLVAQGYAQLEMRQTSPDDRRKPERSINRPMRDRRRPKN